MYNYLYLIQDNKDIGSDIYKIGKTTQSPIDRFKGYLKGTYPIRISQVDNCHIRENELINLFKDKYILFRGREYFKGDINDMIKNFNNLCDICNICNINKNELNHDKKMEYKCNRCSLEFFSNQSLERHKNKKIKCNILTEFKCNICNKYFKQRNNLNEHTRKKICKKSKIFKNDNNQMNINNVYINILESNKKLDDKICLIQKLNNLNSKEDIIKIINAKFNMNTTITLLINNNENII